MAVLAFSEAQGAEWKPIGKSDTYEYYYDAENITRLPGNIVRVWNKAVFNDKGVAEVVRELGSRYKEVYNSVEGYELNCPDKKARPVSLTYYSKKEAILGSSQSGSFTIEMKWDPIAPETAIELVYKAVCK